MRQALQIASIALLMNLVINPAACADDWDVFYQKYGGKFFIMSWDQQDFKKNGAVNPPSHREFGYSMVTANSFRRIWRNENKFTGQVYVPGDCILLKSSYFSTNDCKSKQKIEVQGNTIINTWISNSGEVSGEVIINVNSNTCKAKIVDYEYAGNSNQTIKRTNMVCKVISSN